MKIGLVLSEAPQYSETFFNSKIRNLRSAGIDVILFCGNNKNVNSEIKIRKAYPVYKNKKFKQLIVSTLVLIKTILIRRKAAMRLYRLERVEGASISESLKTVYINAHILTEKTDWLHFGFATMALRRENAAEATGAKMGVSFRGYDINVYPLKNPGCYEKLWKKVDKVHSISEYLYKSGLSLGLSKDVPYEIITPAIDLNKFKMKNNPGALSKKIKILTAGRLNWIKDYETAISAMKILKDKAIDFEYNIIGSGPEMERITFCIYQLGLIENINLFGEKSHDSLIELMRESDIYLQTSMQEGFCVSVLEAQATGLLCVVSDADGLKENVIDKETGWISEIRNPKLFADKIENIINMSGEERKTVSLSARKRIEEKFSMEDQKSRFINFYTEEIK